MLKHKFAFLLPLVLLLLIIAILFYMDYQKFLDTPIHIEQPLVFNIQAGMSFMEINNSLQAAGIIGKQHYLSIYARHSGQAHRLQSGEYELTVGLTPKTLLALFVAGKVTQYSLTIIEGWSLRELLQALHENNHLDKVLDDDPNKLMQQLGLSEQSIEGLFFADTYRFPKGTTDKAFLQKAHRTLQTILAQEWQNRAEGLPYQNAYEALIMASIIEKETGLASERQQIAGIFIRRLQKNMKLQTDPTVIYAMGKQFDGNIRKKDLQIDSPYNTYRYKGLPPSPIAFVGREAIHAALHPDDGKALYFVAIGDGSHYFSATLSEHNRAVARYQLKRRSKKTIK